MIRLAGSIPIWNSDVIIGRVALGTKMPFLGLFVVVDY